MKLLLDENLSHRLIAALQARYPGSIHVRDAGLESADDSSIWQFAFAHRLYDRHQRFRFSAAELCLRRSASSDLAKRWGCDDGSNPSTTK